MKNIINFAAPPAVGTKIFKGDTSTVLTLVYTAPCIRKDGTPGTVLHWLADDGRRYTSGVRSHGVGKPVTFLRCNLPQNQIAR